MTALLTFCSMITALKYGVNGFQQTGRLEQSNDGAWGGWVYQKYCDTHSFVRGFKLKVESNQNGGDDTAANAIRLLCGTSATTTSYEEIALSNEGIYGSWSSDVVCPSGSYITGFDQKVESSQGGSDDTTLNSIKAKCSDGSTIEASNKGSWGSFTGTFAECAASSYVCGFTQKVEGKQGGGDDTALNAVKLFCCAGSGAAHYLYAGTSNALTWWEANAFCAAAYDTQLATISTTNYNNDIDEIATLGFSTHKELWIGLNDQRVEGHWEWVGGFDCNGNSCDGSELSYWSPGEPNDYGSGEDCAEFNANFMDNTWKQVNDNACGSGKPFVCNVQSGGIVANSRVDLWGCFDTNHRNDDHQGPQMEGHKYCGCSDGYGVIGIYRNDCETLDCIESLICAQPTTTSGAASCYNHDISGSFDTAGTVSCNSDYVLTGFLLNSNGCQTLECIEKIRCCTFSGYKQNGARVNSWYSSFDAKGWHTVWGNQYINSLTRSADNYLYAIEEVGSVWLRTSAEIVAYEQALAVKFAPILRFDRAAGGKGYPCTAAQVQGFYDDNVVNAPDVTEADANLYENTDIKKAETFFKVTECGNHHFTIQYRWFYARQHECMSGEGAHFADWEWIIVHVSPNDLPEPGFYVSYFQHGNYYTLNYDQLYREGNHPIVYVGKNSHGNYYDSNDFGGGCGYFYDYRNPNGESDYFRTYNQPMHRLFDLAWSSYNGPWNYDNPNDPGISTDFSMDICAYTGCSSYGCNWEGCDDRLELLLGKGSCIGVDFLAQSNIANVDANADNNADTNINGYMYGRFVLNFVITMLSGLMVISCCCSIYYFCVRSGKNVTGQKVHVFDQVVVSGEEANMIDEQNYQ